MKKVDDAYQANINDKGNQKINVNPISHQILCAVLAELMLYIPIASPRIVSLLASNKNHGAIVMKANMAQEKMMRINIFIVLLV